MKRFSKITALLLSVLMILSVASAAVFAEEEISGDPTVSEDPNTSAPTEEPTSYTVNVVSDGAGVGSFDCYFGGTLNNESFVSDASQLVVSVEPREGYKIISAVLESDENENLVQSGDNFIGIFNNRVLGKTYILRVVTEATTAVPTTLSVNSNVGVTVLDINGLEISDLSIATFAEGDSVTVKFNVDGEFDPSKATLSVNGENVSLTSAEYTFALANGANTVSFNYDLSVAPLPAELTVDASGIGYTVYFNGTAVSDFYGLSVGDTVRIDFAVEGNFLSANAHLTLNGASVALDSPSYTFTAGEVNTVVFSYGAVQGTLNIISDYSYAIFVNDVETDAGAPVFYTGDTVKIVFNVDGEFDPAKAALVHNGVVGTMAGTAFSFVATEVANKITFKYGDAANATLTVNTHGKDLSSIPYSVTVNGSAFDLATSQLKLGDSVTITFDVNIENLADAFLTVGGNKVEVTGNSYTFNVVNENNLVVFGYGVIPVTFVLNGPGSYNIFKTADGSEVAVVTNNNAAGIGTKTLYLNKGENYKFNLTPALNYELSGSVNITEPERDALDGYYFIVPSVESRVSASIKPTSGPTVPTYQISINIQTGGSVTAGGVTYLSGNSALFTVAEGQSLTFTVAAATDYEIDRVIVGGAQVVLTDNSYTISGITANTTVNVYFKSTAAPDDSTIVNVDDVNWGTLPIKIDLSENKTISIDVLKKIATLDSSSGKYVEIVGDYATVYIPYGSVFTNAPDNFSLKVSTLTSGDLFGQINTAVAEQYGGDTVYRVYSISVNGDLPAGAKIGFLLGSSFAGENAILRTFDGNSFADASEALEVSNIGVSGKYDYSNQPTLIVMKQDEATDLPNISEPVISVPQDTESQGEAAVSDVSAEEEGSGATVIVIIIIALVAVAGAAALFIVKWRQEKF